MNHVLTGKEVVDSLKTELREKLNKINGMLTLGVIIPSDDPSSASYLKSRVNLCKQLGINVESFVFDENVTQKIITNTIRTLNDSDDVQGIMIDKPLPSNMNEDDVFTVLDYKKDIDGCSPISYERMLNNDKCLIPSTAVGIMALLHFYKIDIKDKKYVIVNSSKTVGIPLQHLLEKEGAIVTICDKNTENIKEKTNAADVVVVAIGSPRYFTKEYFNKNSIVIDVGINYDENNNLCGDVHEEVYDLVKAYSPVPGGVGPVTTISLLTNLLLGMEL